MAIAATEIQKYHQIRLSLVTALRTYVWQSGEPLPAEDELAQRLGCHPTTIDHILHELIEYGLLERHASQETRVAPRDRWRM